MGEISDERERWVTYENQGGIEVFIILFDIVHVILRCLPLVDGVEIEAGIIVLNLR